MESETQDNGDKAEHVADKMKHKLDEAKGQAGKLVGKVREKLHSIKT